VDVAALEKKSNAETTVNCLLELEPISLDIKKGKLK